MQARLGKNLEKLLGSGLAPAYRSRHQFYRGRKSRLVLARRILNKNLENS